MKKSQYHSICSSELLLKAIQMTDEERGKWFMQFLIDLGNDTASKAVTEEAEQIIRATKKRRTAASESGKKGAKNRWKKERKNNDLNNDPYTRDNTKVKVKVNKPKTKTKRNFKIPDILEIQDYCRERKNNIDAEAFHSFYESKGWMVGKNKMKDWKAAIRTWEKSDKNKTPKNGSGQQMVFQ